MNPGKRRSRVRALGHPSPSEELRSTLHPALSRRQRVLRALARISHILSAADADCGPSASLRSLGLLDVGSTTPSSASLRAPCIRATLCVLATRGCEKCTLTHREKALTTPSLCSEDRVVGDARRRVVQNCPGSAGGTEDKEVAAQAATTVGSF